MSGMAPRLLAVAAYRSSWRVPGGGSGRPKREGDTVSLDVVGAGLGRTGTNSLKLALERLLGAPCYHMLDLLGQPEHVPLWERALDNRPVNWELLFADYRAAIDWAPAAFYSELAAAYPEAIVVLSVRDAEDWW